LIGDHGQVILCGELDLIKEELGVLAEGRVSKRNFIWEGN